MATSSQPHHAGGGGEQQQHAEESVDAGLDHDAGHEGRDVGRGGRVRLGQPDVERDEAGLGAEADDGEDEQQAGERRRCLTKAHLVELQRPAGPSHEEEHGDQERRAQVGRDQVRPPRLADLVAAVLERHQEVRGDRHHLPGDEEEDAVAGGEDHRDAGDEQAGEEPDAADRLARRAPPRGSGRRTRQPGARARTAPRGRARRGGRSRARTTRRGPATGRCSVGVAAPARTRTAATRPQRLPATIPATATRDRQRPARRGATPRHPRRPSPTPPGTRPLRPPRPARRRHAPRRHRRRGRRRRGSRPGRPPV